jgi:hypothetical protein
LRELPSVLRASQILIRRDKKLPELGVALLVHWRERKQGLLLVARSVGRGEPLSVEL